jgi:hypothetical protein
MASEPPISEPGHPEGGGGPTRIAPVRAFVVLVIFVAATAILVAVGTRPVVSGIPAATTTTTTLHHSATPTTTTTTVPRSSVTVLVANATEENGLAAHYSTVLSAQGWHLETPTDAATTESASAVYYAAGQQEAAAAIATSLGLQPSAVQPLTTAVPVPGASGNDVVVVIGADLVTSAGT